MTDYYLVQGNTGHLKIVDAILPHSKVIACAPRDLLIKALTACGYKCTAFLVPDTHGAGADRQDANLSTFAARVNRYIQQVGS